MQRGRLVILAALHGVADCYSLFLPALWLPLQLRFGLSAVQTGLLIAAGWIPANVMQPVFGVIADRFDARRLVIVGPLLAAVCVGLVGLSQWLWLTVVLLMLGTAGTGMFHPEAAALAGRIGVAGRSRAMAVFLTGGFFGQAIGPLLISFAIAEKYDRTFDYSWLTIFPGLAIVLVSAALLRGLPSVPISTAAVRRAPLVQILAGRYRTILCLVAMNVSRYFGLQMILQALSLYLKARGGDQMDVGRWMMVYIGAQGVGILLGGLTAPAHRERLMLILSLVVVLVPAALLPIIEGPSALVCLAAIGLCVAWTFSVAIQLGQEIVPGGQRWISGMMIGFSWGLGALTAPPLAGYLCDHVSTRAPFIVGAIMFAVALCCALTIPFQSHLNRLKSGPSLRDVNGA